MKRFVTLSTPLALVLIWISPVIAEAPHGIVWKKIDDDDRVTVWRGKVEHSSLFGFRGKMIMDAPIDHIAWVLSNRDIDSKRRWVDRVRDFIISESNGKIWVYASYDMPWPVQDRDFITEGKIDIFAKEKRFRMVMTSVKDHPEYPKKKSVGVRAWTDLLRYDLRAIDQRTTEVVVEAWVDPRGWLPAWLVNIISSTWPEKTLLGLYEETKRPSTRAYPKLREQFFGRSTVQAH